MSYRVSECEDEVKKLPLVTVCVYSVGLVSVSDGNWRVSADQNKSQICIRPTGQVNKHK